MAILHLLNEELPMECIGSINNPFNIAFGVTQRQDKIITTFFLFYVAKYLSNSPFLPKRKKWVRAINFPNETKQDIFSLCIFITFLLHLVVHKSFI